MLLCDSIPKVFYPLTIIDFCFNRFNFQLTGVSQIPEKESM